MTAKEKEHIAELQAIADKHANYMKLAFLAAVVQLANSIDNDALRYAISVNSIDGIYRALGIEQFDNLLHGIGMDKKNLIFTDEAREVFNIAAMSAFLQLPFDSQIPWNYNPIGERAVQLFTSDAARIALELTDSLKAGVAIALRSGTAYTADIEQVMQSIKETIGLTSAQAQAVVNFRNQLEARKNLGLNSPQSRLLSEEDRLLVMQHFKNNILSPTQINSMVQRYYETLLNQRAREAAIGATMNAINSGMQSMWQQGLDQGILDARDRKFWVTAGDAKVRPTHRVIPGMNPDGVPINSMFITPTGLVPYPLWGMGDYVHCRCLVYLKRV